MSLRLQAVFSSGKREFDHPVHLSPVLTAKQPVGQR